MAHKLLLFNYLLNFIVWGSLVGGFFQLQTLFTKLGKTFSPLMPLKAFLAALPYKRNHCACAKKKKRRKIFNQCCKALEL